MTGQFNMVCCFNGSLADCALRKQSGDDEVYYLLITQQFGREYFYPLQMAEGDDFLFRFTAPVPADLKREEVSISRAIFEYDYQTMCYKYATPSFEELSAFMPGMIIDPYTGVFFADGFAQPMMPITTNADANRVVQGLWTLIPYPMDRTAAKKYAMYTLNAKSEDIWTTKSYKPFIGKQRCLVWASGFYESQWQDAKGKEKHPFFIYNSDKTPLTFGGVLSYWLDTDSGELIPTYSIITTRANALMADIHNNPDNPHRMPVIISPENRATWLSDISKEEIDTLMQTLPDGTLNAHKVSKLVNNPRLGNRNVPEVQEPYSYNTLL